jgi:nickel transport protein
MTRPFPLTLLRLAALLCLGAPTAFAHDLWIEKSGQQFTLYQGHRHSAHAGAETMDYGKNFVTAALCFDGRGGKRLLAATSPAPWKASGECAALLITASSGYWSKTPWETKNVPKPQAPGAIKSWRSSESIKRLERWAPPFANPLSEGLEIVPEADPFTLKPGDKLIVQVVLSGKPQANVPVAYHGETRGTTDPQGKIAIRLRHGGLQLISASLEQPLADGKADVEIMAATLQFELPQ